ncbi:elongation of very long chain fatty acids protein 1-like isoform X3 [Pseudomyrmex gracilis]|uniref:elongation of very long chain fatty acids protein 1-like isoform X3 n=1 Tax=Pseudomyrmex gracilis TaxID=219809 RepID=UPI00099573F0|nr:elongation of very long chain fatty acids protein 1-like isoform X3 [Pseudomyrmex gracilis]
MGLEESYDQLMGESEILPTAKWPLIHNPVLIVLITIGYLYFILYAGPCYMKDRPPFKLKTFMLFYDVIQILANAWIIKEFIAAGWFTIYGIQCTLPDSNSPSALHTKERH